MGSTLVVEKTEKWEELQSGRSFIPATTTTDRPYLAKKPRCYSEGPEVFVDSM
jgi:hypothetical protein